jgi:hypothetical protein
LEKIEKLMHLKAARPEVAADTDHYGIHVGRRNDSQVSN